MKRRLKPREAAILIRRGLLEAGIEDVAEQVDAIIATLRAYFARATREDDLLVVETLRAFGQSESRIWALFCEWCAEINRDETQVFEHCWAPDLDNDGEDQKI